VIAVAPEGDTVRGDTWDRGSAGSNEGDFVGEPDRALGEQVDLVADADVLPIARVCAPWSLGQDVILDRC
jgi:hypothetical protein